MDWRNHVKKIQESMRTAEKYEDYVPLLENYKQELEFALTINPSNVIFSSQLASVYMELRQSAEDSIKILENIFEKCTLTMSPADNARILTNLAYHYSDGYYDVNAIKYLKQAVEFGSNFKQTYGGLGLLLAGEDEYQEAISHFEKVITLSDDVKYRQNLAVSLYGSGRVKEAITIFEAILKEHEQYVKAMHGLATCYATLGEFEKALELCLEIIETEEMEKDDISDIYFLCGEYQLHYESYQDGENLRLYPQASWLASYFYSLAMLGKKEELALRYKEVMKEKQLDYDEAVVEELEEGETEFEREFHLLSLKEQMQEIEEVYEQALMGNKPVIDVKLWCEYECYLIDCVRHQVVEE